MAAPFRFAELRAAALRHVRKGRTDLKYDDLGIDLQKSYGFGFDADYDLRRLPPLDECDREKWYAKFYYEGRGELPEETKKHFAPGNPMDAACALLPGDCDRLTQRRDDAGDLGYCLLPDGVGYGSTHTLMRGVTPEMFDWYKRLRLTDRLSYQIWYPGAHYSELGGVTVEDVGFGRSRLHFLSPNSPENLGFTRHPTETDGEFCFLIGGNTVSENLEHPEVRPYVSSLFHYVRLLPEGLDFRTHFYIGALCADGKLVRVQRLAPEVCLEMARRMVSHCCYERSRVETFLPELYERMKDVPLAESGGEGGLRIMK